MVIQPRIGNMAHCDAGCPSVQMETFERSCEAKSQLQLRLCFSDVRHSGGRKYNR